MPYLFEPTLVWQLNWRQFKLKKYFDKKSLNVFMQQTMRCKWRARWTTKMVNHINVCIRIAIKFSRQKSHRNLLPQKRRRGRNNFLAYSVLYGSTACDLFEFLLCNVLTLNTNLIIDIWLVKRRPKTTESYADEICISVWFCGCFAFI